MIVNSAADRERCAVCPVSLLCLIDRAPGFRYCTHCAAVSTLFPANHEGGNILSPSSYATELLGAVNACFERDQYPCTTVVNLTSCPKCWNNGRGEEP
jgi:hypothetical protein